MHIITTVIVSVLLQSLHCVASTSLTSCNRIYYWCYRQDSSLIYSDTQFSVQTGTTYAQCIQYCDSTTSCKAVQYDPTQRECRFNSFLSNDRPYQTQATYDVFWKNTQQKDCSSQGMVNKALLRALKITP